MHAHAGREEFSFYFLSAFVQVFAPACGALLGFGCFCVILVWAETCGSPVIQYILLFD